MDNDSVLTDLTPRAQGKEIVLEGIRPFQVSERAIRQINDTHARMDRVLATAGRHWFT